MTQKRMPLEWPADLVPGRPASQLENLTAPAM
jgi:hypothetical protein